MELEGLELDALEEVPPEGLDDASYEEDAFGAADDFDAAAEDVSRDASLPEALLPPLDACTDEDGGELLADESPEVSEEDEELAAASPPLHENRVNAAKTSMLRITAGRLKAVAMRIILSLDKVAAHPCGGS